MVLLEFAILLGMEPSRLDQHWFPAWVQIVIDVFSLMDGDHGVVTSDFHKLKIRVALIPEIKVRVSVH